MLHTDLREQLDAPAMVEYAQRVVWLLGIALKEGAIVSDVTSHLPSHHLPAVNELMNVALLDDRARRRRNRPALLDVESNYAEFWLQREPPDRDLDGIALDRARIVVQGENELPLRTTHPERPSNVSAEI
jgi:hypothetical protein